ncbi:PEP motif putative anchor domain protein [Oleidesulfovibrio alaskensis G20]|jgi:hypothetical protein|uniref:PEP motif putative anchor domain protein n=2 Tax=Oleidesulfovibrio alaskensis TaxID=58180 RepID=Q30YD9_OLEA2|nr:THxN family PEP-CTERM protein [Oleidesulfovibrio alaskensis]ABB39307.1 PEP motif putative anchor domain protein [Oleidesulfovibrio alaskensis G20]MBL3581801.1 PEP-CTERM sorting domain-containing protein [Oleidesulfovibrio alaskensis]
MKTVCRIAMVLVATLIFVSSASAGVVTSWQYSYDAGFVDWTWAQSGDSGGVKGPVNLNGETGYHTLWWGSSLLPLFQSRIELNAPVSGVVNTGGAPAAAMTMTHYNRWTTSALVSGTVKAVLELQALEPVAGEPATLSTELDFSFYEKSIFEGMSRDVFILNNPQVTFEGFEYDGEWYTLDFGGSFGVIPEYYIQRIGLDTGLTYYGWVTSEFDSTVVDTSFSISHVMPQPAHAPEPATMGLMGLGMLAMGGYALWQRRKKS